MSVKVIIIPGGQEEGDEGEIEMNRTSNQGEIASTKTGGWWCWL